MDVNQIIEEQLKALPPEVKKVIVDSGWTKIADTIANQFYLNQEQIDSFKTEVMLTLLAIENPNELPHNLATNLGIAADTAEQISNAVNRQILPLITDAWNEARINQPLKADPLAVAKEKFAKIAGHGRFPVTDLTERFASLPKNVQEIITGSKIAETISPLAAKYDLHIDQAGVLAEISIVVMLGLIKTTDFIGELEKALGVSKIKASDIAYEVDQKLFKPIRDVLKQVAQEREVASAEPKPAPVAPLEPNTYLPDGKAGNLTPEASNIIHPHPASRPYYGSAPQIGSATVTLNTGGVGRPDLVKSGLATSSKITDQKLTTVVTAPAQDTIVKPTIDPYREPI